MASQPIISIPRPCSQPWAAMAPTAQGRHCAACATEVVDFTRMSDAEMLAFMASAARKGQRVCAFMAAPAIEPRHLKRVRSPRRWLLAVAAFFGWKHASALDLPSILPLGVSVSKQTPGATVVIRGVVLDDSLKVPVPGAKIYIGDTKYGVVADERGEFVLSLPADWGPLKGGAVKLRIGRVPFALLEQTVEVSVKGKLPPASLTIRLLSVPERGHYMGKPVMEPAPVPVPRGRKGRN